MTASPEVRMAKAQDYLANAKAYEAIRELETLIEDVPTHFQAHVQLGLINLKLGAITRGKQFLEKALSLASTQEDQARIHMILREQKQLDKRRYYRPDFDALRKQNKE